MKLRTLAAGCALLISCGPPRLPVPLSPLGRLHVREHYRYQVEGSAIVLPVLDCTAAEPDLRLNPIARLFSSTHLAEAIWHELHLPGAPQDGRLAESDDLCRELSDNYDSGTNVDDASPVMRERLRDFFSKNPDRVWLLVFTRYLRLGDRVPGPSPGVGALSGQVVETDTLNFNAYLFSVRGDIAFRADGWCRPDAADEEHDCGPEYQRLGERVAELLEGLPRSVLLRAAIVKALPQRGLPVAAPRTARVVEEPPAAEPEPPPAPAAAEPDGAPAAPKRHRRRSRAREAPAIMRF